MLTKKYKNGFVLELPAHYKGLVGWYQNSEVETQDWIIDNAQKNWVSLDCGAHLGYYAMLLSYLCPRGRVHAIEAHSGTLAMMRENIQHNSNKFGYDFSNLQTWHFAVGDEDKELTTKIWYTGTTPDTIGETIDKVDFLTLDTFIAGEEIQVDFIKSDVDGWDYELLLGAKQTMQNQRPIIIAEINYALGWRNHTAYDVLDLLNERNYKYRKLDAACPQNWLMTPLF